MPIGSQYEPGAGMLRKPHLAVPPARLQRARSSRATIGVLTACLSDGYTSTAWSGVMEVARERDANVILFAGARLRTPLASEAPAAAVFDLPCPANVDGLVICAELLYHFVDASELNRFVARYRPLPMTSIGRLEDVPSVIPDIQQGVSAMMEHLIGVHGYRRLVFLRGPVGEETAEAGYRGYVQTLADHGIAFNPDLVSVAPRHWGKTGGAASTQDLLDERHLQPGGDFDAIICLGDNETLGAMEVLQQRGYDLPFDVAVSGLNNIEIARFITPSLTTVDRQIAEVARQATARLFDLLQGHTVPLRTVVRPTVIVRRSCGCMPATVLQAASAPALPGVAAEPEAAADARAAVLAALRRAGRPGAAALAPDLPLDWQERLVDGFFADLDDAVGGRTLAALEANLRLVIASQEDVVAWNGILSELRSQARAWLTGARLQRAEDIWQQARALIGAYAEHAQGMRKLELGQQVEFLSHITQSLITTFDVPDLMDTLAGELPRLGIPSGYLSLYEDPAFPVRRARLILAYDAGGRMTLDPHGSTYATPQLLLLPGSQQRRLDLIVLPLYFQDEQLGLLALEMGPHEGNVYEGLRVQIASALKGAALARRNAELYEAAVQARRVAEEADRLKGRFLSTVSHELRTPLTLIVGTLELMLPGGPGNSASVPEPWRGDLECVHASAQHLARLITDVLDLASSQTGQLRLACQPLDLTRLLHQAATIAEPMVREKGLRWLADIPNGLPYIWGDHTRLQQVILNLVANAVKFTEEGEIRLQVTAMADQVTVAVSDTGIGIPAGEQDAIFDEFRQSERTTGRGYGGIGLGLAICRRLIEMHGGKIAAQSRDTQGGGSTFYFSLPAIYGPAVETEINERRGETVLLLTDAPDPERSLARASGETRLSGGGPLHRATP